MSAPTRLLFITFIVLAVFHLAEAVFRCHNFCSGHGTCSELNHCQCVPGWQGVDCTERTCDMGRAWADKASDVDVAHHYVECSSRGLCNRKTGKCECFSGFTGSACQKATCGASNCNGHGTCVTMNQAIQTFTSFKRQVEYYHSWEVNHVTMCACEIGYDGPDCSIKLCPKGDDPNTNSTGFRTIKMIVDVQPRASGQFRFSFNGETFSFPTQADLWRDAQCKASFEALPNVETVNCTSIRVNSRRTDYTITFLKFPTVPYENNIYRNDGNPPLSAFFCDTARVTNSRKVFCELSDVVTGSDVILQEYELCSNRGICNPETGMCKCLTNFMNANCDAYQTGYSSLSRTLGSDVLHIVSVNPDFHRSVLRLHSTSQADADVNFLRLETTSGPLFEIDGSGSLRLKQGSLSVQAKEDSTGGTYINGGVSINGGQTILSGGLYVTEKTIVNGTGLRIYDGGYRVRKGGNTIYDGGLSSFEMMEVFSNGVKVLDDGLLVLAGGATISTGGLTVEEGLNVTAGGVAVLQRGMTIHNLGLRVRGGMTLEGTAGFVTSSGVSVYDGGLHADGGVTILGTGLAATAGNLDIGGGGLVVSGHVDVLAKGLIVTGGLTVLSNFLNVTAGDMTINSGGIYSASGLHVFTGGLTVSASGLVVAAGGLTVFDVGTAVQGGITLETGSVNILGASVTPRGMLVSGLLKDNYNGVLVLAGGASVRGGLTVSDTGLQTSGGLTLRGGLSVSEGLVVQQGGLGLRGGLVSNGQVYIPDTAGLRVSSGGLSVSLGLISPSVSVQSDGVVVVTGGLTVASAGGRVSGGVTIAADGLQVSADGLSLFDGGLFANGGVSSTDGLAVAAGGLFVASGGLTVPSGLTILSLNVLTPQASIIGGLTVATGVTVRSAGIVVSDAGVTITNGGIVVTGGITTNGNLLPNTLSSEGGFSLNNGLTVDSPGLNLNRLQVEASYLAAQTGLTVNSGGINTPVANINDGLVVSSGGVIVRDTGVMLTQSGLTMTGNVIITRGGLRSFTNGIQVGRGLTVNTGGLQIAGGLTVNNGGVVTPNAAINSAGLRITQSSLTINSGGLVSGARLSVATKGILSQDKVLVNDGMVVAGGTFNVRSGGLVITTGGLTTSTASVKDGLRAEDGMVITSGGLTIADTGLVLESGATNGMRITTGGARILTTNTNKFLVTGGVIVSGGLTVYSQTKLQSSYSVFSDARLKKNITIIEKPVEKLSKIRGVYYSLRPEFLPPKAQAPGRQVGVIAQEVRAVLPEVVHGSEDTGFLSVSYDDIIPVVLAAVQELGQQFAQNSTNSNESDDVSCGCKEQLEQQIRVAKLRLEELEKESAELRARAVALLSSKILS